MTLGNICEKCGERILIYYSHRQDGSTETVFKCRCNEEHTTGFKKVDNWHEIYMKGKEYHIPCDVKWDYLPNMRRRCPKCGYEERWCYQ